MTDVALGHPMSFSEIHKAFAQNTVRKAAVPAEYAVSLPLPSLRWGRPVFAGFAGPARRIAGQPEELSAPDVWWAVSADHGELVVFARIAVLPFGELPAGEPVEIEDTGRSLADRRQDIRILEELMNAAAPGFLAGKAGTQSMRTDLAAVLGIVLPAETMAWYHALVPDFFGWLYGGDSREQ